MDTRVAEIITADGTVDRMTADDLMSMKKAVGGYVEHLSINRVGDMYVNEDGRKLDLLVNEKASYFANQKVVGNVVLVWESEEARLYMYKELQKRIDRKWRLLSLEYRTKARRARDRGRRASRDAERASGRGGRRIVQDAVFDLRDGTIEFETVFEDDTTIVQDVFFVPDNQE